MQYMPSDTPFIPELTQLLSMLAMAQTLFRLQNIRWKKINVCENVELFVSSSVVSPCIFLSLPRPQ